ncbi:MAG: MarR family transcriptional regulator [Candidatus Thorarchaeota archaeon]
MTPKSDTKRNEQEHLEKMVQLTKIIGLDSCLLIYSYLLLFGQTTPAKLRDVTGLSKATMFRNLALLLEAGLIEKEDVKTTSDKRYSLHYHISRDLMKTASQLGVKSVVTHAQKEGKSSQLIMQLAQTPTDDSEDACLVISRFLSFRVDEVEDLSALFHLMHEVVERFDSLKSSKKRNMKKSLRTPVVLSISLTATGSDQPELPKGAVAFVRQCEPIQNQQEVEKLR